MGYWHRNTESTQVVVVMREKKKSHPYMNYEIISVILEWEWG